MEPIPCFVAGNKGYVWDANGAMRLRKKHRIMGCLVGTVAQFKNQNEVNFLPMELSADEVTLAVRQGWVELCPGTAAPIRAASARAALNASMAAAAAAGAGAKASGGGASAAAWGGRRGADAEWEDRYQEYYSQFDPLVGFTGRFLPLIGAKRRKLSQQQPKQQPPQQQQPTQQQQQQLGSKFDGRSAAVAAAGGKDERARKLTVEKPAAEEKAAVAPPAPDLSEPGWRAAVTDGGPYDLPLTAAAAASARGGVAAADAAAQSSAHPRAGAKTELGSKDTPGAADAPAGVKDAEGAGRDACTAVSTSGRGGGPVDWQYPSTDYERLRFSVFCDLHRQGFMMTGGIKFGSDMLAYPGDPSLYHAQFTVRPVAPGTALNPMVLKAAARGSHAARKHLLLAFYEDGDEASAGGSTRIKYMSFAPEAGFGSKA